MIKKDDIRKISVTGESETYYVTIPKDIIKELQWKKGQKVVVSIDDKAVVIRDWEADL